MKTIIITGANRGIGFDCALQMAKLAKDEQIIITSRDLASGNNAAQKIKERTGNTHIKLMVMDLGSLASIKQFAEEFSSQKNGRISVLINNAELQNVGEIAYTKDGIEETSA